MKFIQKIGIFFVLFVSFFSIDLRAMDAEKARELLGAKKDATQQEIESIYRKLALEYHPDKNSSPEAVGKFNELGEAKECLLRELEGTQAIEQENSIIDSIWRIIEEKKEQLTFYDLIGVSIDADSKKINAALSDFAQVWEEFEDIINSMIAPGYNYCFAFSALQSALTTYRQEYDAYLALPYIQKLIHEKYRPLFWYALKKEAKSIAKESLIGLAGGIAAGAAYLGFAALTKTQDCMRTLPDVVSFYGYTTLTAVFGAGIGVNVQRSKSWTSLLGIGTRVLIFCTVTKFSAKYVEAGLKLASII